MLNRTNIVVSVLIALSPTAQEPGSAREGTAASRRTPRDEPARRYETRKLEGWTVLVNRELSERQPELTARGLKELGLQLYQVTRVVPTPALRKLREIRIWVEEREAEPPCMTYHPDPGWLREHGKNPAKARCIELANIRTFLEWTTQQPWMVLHELAHGYHHQFLDRGFENADIKATYQEAMRAKLYDSVLRINGRMDRGYAATNDKEYFAEMSESYFGTNDFFPFVRAELQRHDSRAFELIRRMWGVRSKGGRTAARRTSNRRDGRPSTWAAPRARTRMRPIAATHRNHKPTLGHAHRWPLLTMALVSSSWSAPCVRARR